MKVCVLEYKRRYIWSKLRHCYYWSENIGDQVWAHDNVPLKTKILELEEMIKFISKNPGDSKEHRSAFFKFNSEIFPLKDFVGMDKWNGLIYVDLDLNKSQRIMRLNADKQMLLYSHLDYALQNVLPNNYCYIEHSSSKVGIHCLFYFDCEKNEENFKKYAKYIYQVFRYKIDKYIKNFSHIFTDPDCLKSNGKSTVFDDVYNRAYQKLYITTIDYKYHKVNGSCEGIVVEEDEESSTIKEDEVKTKGNFNVKYITTKKKWALDHNDRYYVLTALKRYVGDRMKAYKLWYDFCQNISLYKHYTTNDFINQFEKEWDKIDAEQGHISILRKYGFKINDNEIHYELKEDQYLSDVYEDVIKNSVNGINMLVAGTGVGKTQAGKILNDKCLSPLEFGMHKPILVIEPLNSIIETKYDNINFRIVTGSNYIGNVNNYQMIVTNYNHLVKYSNNGIEVIEDIDMMFSKYELVIIDESHIMLKDIYRAEVLIPFMIELNKITSTKVVIQTATPMFEQSILNIKRTFYVNKKETIHKKVIFRQANNDFNIQDITCLVDYYIGNNKKVYIYWNNGSLQNMRQFKSIYHSPDKVVIYHKRNKDDIDMKYVSTKHNIDKYNIIMSSVYFGVGNDLDDELDDVAVIIIGMNCWQEDIQAIGRWRNVKNVETCIILLPNEMEFVNSTKETTFKFVDQLNKNQWRNKQVLYDKCIKNKSVIINNVSYEIKNEEYAEILAKMQTAADYSSQFKVKCDEFERRGYDVRPIIKPLESNQSWLAEIKTYKKKLKNIRNSEINKMLNGEYDYDEINKDGKMSTCARIIKKMQNLDLLQYCEMSKFSVSKIMRYDTFLQYYRRKWIDMQDYAELFSILWVRQRLSLNINKEYNFICDDNTVVTLTYDKYIIACGYLIWLSYRNQNEDTKKTKYFYFNKFKKICYDFNNIEQKLIEKIFIENYYNEEYNEFYKKFFNTTEDLLKNENEINEGNLFEHIAKIQMDEQTYITNLRMILDSYSGKIRGQLGNQDKKCVITDKFKNPYKYRLSVGQEFESHKALSEYTGKSVQSISQWKKKGWIR